MGLTLAEGKALLASLQQHVVTAQIQQHVEAIRSCPQCGSPFRTKGLYQSALRSVYGAVAMRIRRLRPCPCFGSQPQSFSTLFTNKSPITFPTTMDQPQPEVKYLPTDGSLDCFRTVKEPTTPQMWATDLYNSAQSFIWRSFSSQFWKSLSSQSGVVVRMQPIECGVRLRLWNKRLDSLEDRWLRCDATPHPRQARQLWQSGRRPQKNNPKQRRFQLRGLTQYSSHQHCTHLLQRSPDSGRRLRFRPPLCLPFRRHLPCLRPSISRSRCHRARLCQRLLPRRSGPLLPMSWQPTG